MKKLLKKKVNVFGKKLPVFLIVLIAVTGFVSAALLTYFGVITGTVTVGQGLFLDGKAWDDDTIIYSESLTSLEAKTVSSGVHNLENTASVNAVVTLDTECTPTGDGCNELVNNDKITTEYVLDNTGGTCGGGSPTCEKRIHIRAEDVGVDSLNDLTSMNWESFIVDGGYIAHIDVLIDTTGNGIKDDALVFEYDKVTAPSNELVSEMDFQRGTWTTDAFDNKGIVDGDAIAWLTTEDAGPGGLIGYTAYTLTEWKSGLTSATGKIIPANVAVIGFEIEVDNWIVESNGKIRNIQINAVDVDEVTVLAGEELDFQIITDFPKMMLPDTYTIETTVTPVL